MLSTMKISMHFVRMQNIGISQYFFVELEREPFSKYGPSKSIAIAENIVKCCNLILR